MKVAVIVLVFVAVLVLIGLAIALKIVKQYEQGVLSRAGDLRPWRSPAVERDRRSMEGVLAGHSGPEESGMWWWWPLVLAERACCCPATPAVVVLMPPTEERPYPVDLLLCARHYRCSVGALPAAG
jgi:regulator of protease activity HflC (stomatin/prohibitin superfamily)